MLKLIDAELFDAVKTGDLEGVKSALAAGAGIKAKDEYGESALIYGAQGDSLEIVKLLLENGAKIDFKGEQSRTPLHYAINKQKTRIAEYLIGKGADINAKDTKRRSVLYQATEMRNDEIVRLLIEKGADVNIVTRGNTSCLSLAASRADNLDMVKLFVAAGGDLTLGVFLNALITATESGDTRVLEYLFDSGMENFPAYSDGVPIIQSLETHSLELKGTAAVVKLLKARSK